MKMQSDTSILNFGDTSFRRDQYMVEFKELLSILHEHMVEHDNSWASDSISQGNYYLRVLSSTEIFDRNENEDPAKRGRTLTNSLVKTGLITNKRELTEVGKAWLNETIKEPDSFEAIFSLSIDNLVFLRQWTKFRFFNPAGDRYFSPFLFTLKFLSKHQEVEQSDFIAIIHSIHPSITQENLDILIDDYSRVKNKEISLTEFMALHIDEINSDEDNIENTIEEILSAVPIDPERFNKYFKHGKSQETGGALYLEFVEKLINYRENNSKENYDALYNISKEDTVKKGFGYGSLPFEFSRRKNYTTEEFNEDNKDSLLLRGTLYDIYDTFKKSKREDLLREYGDLTSRLLNLTGMVSFNKGLVSLLTNSVIKELFEKIDIPLVSNGNFTSYERHIESPFFKNLTFMEFLEISEEELNAITAPIAERYGLENINELITYFENERDSKFHQLLVDKFTKEETINILDLIYKRDDMAVFDKVTDNTNIPTIMEYMTGIAWYHLSEEKPNLRKSLNLSLDANYLPLSHASGNQGDIEIEQSNQVYLLEATLMDMSNQRRNELEPVIRHAANLAIDNSPKPVQTFFIGNEIDDNVSNIFRACSYINLKHSKRNLEIQGIEIFPLTINELIALLEKDMTDLEILSVLNEEKLVEPEIIPIGWREPVVEKLLL